MPNNRYNQCYGKETCNKIGWTGWIILNLQDKILYYYKN